MVLTLTWMPWIKFLSGRTCILLWILYGNMVDFSFIVSLYVSDLPNVTIRVLVYGEKPACVSNGVGTVLCVRYAVTYRCPHCTKRLRKTYQYNHVWKLRFPCAYSTMCKPRPAFARTEGKYEYGYEYRREMARLVVLTHDARC